MKKIQKKNTLKSSCYICPGFGEGCLRGGDGREGIPGRGRAHVPADWARQSNGELLLLLLLLILLFILCTLLLSTITNESYIKPLLYLIRIQYLAWQYIRYPVGYLAWYPALGRKFLVSFHLEPRIFGLKFFFWLTFSWKLPTTVPLHSWMQGDVDPH